MSEPETSSSVDRWFVEESPSPIAGQGFTSVSGVISEKEADALIEKLKSERPYANIWKWKHPDEDSPPEQQVSKRTQLIREQQRSGGKEITAIMVSGASPPERSEQEQPPKRIWIVADPDDALRETERQVAVLTNALEEILNSSIEFDDKRMGYVVMQIDRAAIKYAQAALAQREEK